MAECGAEHFFLPVCVCIAESCSLSGVSAIAVDDEIAESRAGHHVEIVAGSGNVEVGGECHLRFAAASGLCCDDDHTVRCTGTIDSSSGSRLEDGHVLDVLGIDERQGVRRPCDAVAFHGHTVDHDKRCVGSGERSTAANLDRGSAGRVAAVGRYDHAGACSDEKILCRGGEACFDFRWLDNAYRTGGVGFLYCTVADNNEFVHCYSIGGECHVDGCAALDGYFLSVASHIGEYESCGRIDLDAVLAVDVGDCAVAGDTFYLDACSDGGLAFGIMHGAGHRDLLR